MDTASNQFQQAALQLLDWCRTRNWAGWDPYDALNSNLFSALPFLDSKWPRLVLTQTLKRAPINLRPLLLIAPSQNPKALGLFLQANLKLGSLELTRHERACEELVRSIASLRAPGQQHWCWGYSFPWQTRGLCVPRGAANLVCTTFVAEALIDYHDLTGQAAALEMAVSAARYIVDELYWTGGDVAAFRYPLPDSQVPVHNANFLAAALLCRLAEHDPRFREIALKVARYSAGKQNSDGSWVYGESDNWSCIDHFHTGFNLCALRRIGLFLQSDEFETNLKSGYDFYRGHFFTADGAPKYFHNRALPFDVHSAAQGLITLTELRGLSSESAPQARQLLNWTTEHLRDSEGFFYYQERAWGRIKIPYMRWGQAWMLLAMATVLEAQAEERIGIDRIASTRKPQFSGALR
jgi:hypothetical protein